MGIKLGWRVLILFILSYIIMWAIFAVITPGGAVAITLMYWYIESKFQKKEKARAY